MRFQLINKLLTDALEQLLRNDSHLLTRGLNERAISYRLALHLTSIFNNFNVDCEYNGNVDDTSGRKYIRILQHRARELGLLNKRELRLLDAQNLGQEPASRLVYPDIIIHRRGLNGPENNLLVIELKKASNQKGVDWDLEKLARFTSRDYDNIFEYQFGAFIRFHTGKIRSMKLSGIKMAKGIAKLQLMKSTRTN